VPIIYAPFSVPARALAAAAAVGLITAAVLPHRARAQVSAQTLTLTDAYDTSGQELLRRLSDSPGNIVRSAAP
jgi:hypothetical protein